MLMVLGFYPNLLFENLPFSGICGTNFLKDCPISDSGEGKDDTPHAPRQARSVRRPARDLDTADLLGYGLAPQQLPLAFVTEKG